MKPTCLLISGVVALSMALSTGAAYSQDRAEPLHVALTSVGQSYVLGEPVWLNVIVTNAAGKLPPIRMMEVLVERTEPEIKIYISKDGRTFEEWVTGVLPIFDVERDIETLGPKGHKCYSLRVLYDREHASHLAFPEPGQYWVKVRFPAVTFDPYNREEISSNTIRLRIEQPQGEDAEVWHRINDEDNLKFLQVGSGGKETALKFAELLKTTSKTTYHDDIQWALSQYYQRQMRLPRRQRQPIKQEQAERIREVTGITEPRLFPDDDRLERIITFSDRTPLQEILEELSRQSGVPLTLDPRFHKRLLKGTQVTTQSLGQFMSFMSQRVLRGTEWVREGDGYLLKPADEPDETEGQEDKKEER